MANICIGVLLQESWAYGLEHCAFPNRNQRCQLRYPTSEREENGISEGKVSDALDGQSR